MVHQGVGKDSGMVYTRYNIICRELKSLNTSQSTYYLHALAIQLGLKSVSPGSSCPFSELQNVTIFGKRAVADVASYNDDMLE